MELNWLEIDEKFMAWLSHTEVYTLGKMIKLETIIREQGCGCSWCKTKWLSYCQKFFK